MPRPFEGRRRWQAGRFEPQQGSVGAGADHCVEEELVVVLPIHPGRVHQHGQQVGTAVGRRGQAPRVVGDELVELGGTRHRPVID
ncbi:MAG TPA: hypothetical protein VLL25_03850, partial [Acidimicrobiales bacterium]|nr:hypothetical protein [Acidimicrobiales bacterium]